MGTVVDKTNVNEVNLAVLKRLDPEVEQVLGNAAHVCLYVMSLETQAWERKNVEGSLFLLKRRTNPRFQIVVLNKLATENYYETIHGGFEVEIQAPYLMYTQGDGKVHGIWFYEEKDLDAVAGLLSRVKTGLPRPDMLPAGVTEAAPAAQPAPAASAPAGGAGRSGEDGGFWDKQVVVDPAHVPAKPGFPGGAPLAAPQPAEPAGGGNTITNLFKNAQLKQQQAAPAASAGPSAGGAPLPPSFFKQQAAAPQPAAPAPAAPKPAAENPLQRLFSKGASSIPAPAAPPPPAPAPNVLSTLFSNAAQKAAAVPPAAPAAVMAPVPRAAPQPATPPAAQPARPQQNPAQVQAALRTALSRLVQREAFVDMLAEELRGVGLLH
uniref:WH1 domain-containing protein n=1 Tax=Chlamydomonas leiostraca TaxID=1034604 RepID=A0A7S0S2H6_9CHLO|mmetsp:Transcript_37585/g.94915  ORF Transcript_37585/g.94915 Transcript_37585/m.94915 type:complete len:379 (+) Transcript_37585:143-1279(+)